MRTAGKAATTLAAVVMLAAPAAAGAVVPQLPAGVVVTPREPAPQQLIVRFEAAASATERASARDRAGVDLDRRLALPQTQLVEAGGDLDAAAARLERQPGVRYAIPNITYRALAAAPDDPLFPRQWGLRNSGQIVDGVPGTPGADVNALAAWDLTRGAGQTIAVIDTGVDLTHPDVQPNLWRNPGEVVNGADDDGNGKVDDVDGWDFVGRDNDPNDFDEHGTHVAGTAAAVAGNGAGGAGVAPQARIMALRVLDGEGTGGLAGILDAVAYASAKGATVINLSLGAAPDAADLPAVRDLWTSAIADAGARGAVVVAAAGNDASDNDAVPDYPCAAPNANLVCVAALDASGERDASYSNYGATTVDVGAPGTAIVSSVPAYSGIKESFTAAAPPSLPVGWATDAWRTAYSGVPALGTAAVDSIGSYASSGTSSWNELYMSPRYSVSGRQGCRFSYLVRLDVATGDQFWGDVDTPRGLLEFDVISGSSGGGYFRVDHSLESVTSGAVGARFTLYNDGRAPAGDGAYVDDVEIRCRTTVHGAGDYTTMSGTSMASPHVAGVVALARAAAPGLTPPQVVAAVKAGTVPVASLAGVTTTGGRVDALKAVQIAAGIPPQQPVAPPVVPPPVTTPPATTTPITPAPAPAAPTTPSRPATPSVARGACAGKRGAALRRCGLDALVKATCGRLRGAKRTTCAKRVRAQQACKALPQRTRRQRAKRAQCTRRADAIGRAKKR